MNVSEAIRTKRAVRQFQAVPLPEEAVLVTLVPLLASSAAHSCISFL